MILKIGGADIKFQQAHRPGAYPQTVLAIIAQVEIVKLQFLF